MSWPIRNIPPASSPPKVHPDSMRRRDNPVIGIAKSTKLKKQEKSLSGNVESRESKEKAKELHRR
ncbi:hypothetical protein BDW62DRAFT_176360 [Aspergillus aurantiobrunneus]